MSKTRDSRRLTIMVVPEGSRESRTVHVSYRSLRALAAAGSVVALALTVMAGSWWYLAARASRVGELEMQIRTMEGDRARLQQLTRQIDGIEGQYERIRALFGVTASTPDAPSEVWLPPATGGRRAGAGEALPRPGPTHPTTWPLTERGFVTQGLLEGVQGEHPGLDIAVPSDSYIVAAGGGTVVDAGDDPVYGTFVVIDHGDGYASLYGHAALSFVTRGQRVREREVIALTGSTGRSTAPHLHFEILYNGEAVDPLSMVRQPT